LVIWVNLWGFSYHYGLPENLFETEVDTGLGLVVVVIFQWMVYYKSSKLFTYTLPADSDYTYPSYFIQFQILLVFMQN
jgi:hypothetical protein